MNDDIAKVTFQLSEMEAHTSMLETQNRQLKDEIATMSGDIDPSLSSSSVSMSTKSAVSNANIRRPVNLDNMADDDNVSIASSVPYNNRQTNNNNNNNSGFNNRNSNGPSGGGNSSRVSMSSNINNNNNSNNRMSTHSSSGSLHRYNSGGGSSGINNNNNGSSGSHDDPERLLSESQRKDLIDDVSTHFLALCSEHQLDDNLTTIVRISAIYYIMLTIILCLLSAM